MKTLYIIDNGESYSDHDIYFVETHWSNEVVEQVVRSQGHEIVASGRAAMKWIANWKPRELAEYIYVFKLVEASDEWTKLPRRFLKEAVEAHPNTTGTELLAAVLNAKRATTKPKP